MRKTRKELDADHVINHVAYARIERMVRKKWTASFLKGKDLVAYRNALSDVLDELTAMRRKG